MDNGLLALKSRSIYIRSQSFSSFKLSSRTKQATKLRPIYRLILFRSCLFGNNISTVAIERVESMLIQLYDVESSILATMRSTVGFEEGMCIGVQASSEAFRTTAMAKFVVVENESLKVCGTRKRHESAVVDSSGHPACAEAFDFDASKALLIPWTDDCEETMEGVGVCKSEVMPV